MDINETNSIKVKNILSTFTGLIKLESFGGILLFFATILAIFIANTEFFSTQYFAFWNAHFGFSFNDLAFSLSMRDWVNDGLMAIFFLVVGLEIKRELLIGDLASIKKAAFPIIAAFGGIIVPVIIFLLLTLKGDHFHGFGIPMATDIAFALGVLMLLGKRVPVELKVFLVTLAVVDDLGAIVIIAIFYSKGISFLFLFLSFLVTCFLFILNRFGVKRTEIYLAIGVILWFLVLASGVHATIAGVVLAFTIPLYSRMSEKDYLKSLYTVAGNFTINNEQYLPSQNQRKIIADLQKASAAVQSPLIQIEHFFHPLSTYFIMPVFAFANAGVILNGVFEVNDVAIGVALGLIFGKPIGILGATFLATKLKIANKPESLTWDYILGAGMIAGIGFTMSIFIANLTFGGEMLENTKIAVLASSLVAAIVGVLFFHLYLFKKHKKDYKKETRE